MKTLGIIPARYASSRLPGKPLLGIGGKPMIQWVYERAGQASELDRLLVATDDGRILQAVQSFGGEALLTDEEHLSGTDRCAEVVRKLATEGETYDVVVNIQGDEPLIDPGQINAALEVFKMEEAPAISSLYKRITSEEELFNPNMVKVVFAENRNALYFSRHPIPFCRGVGIHDWLERGIYYRHLGLYAYQTEVLLQLAELPAGKLEVLESLEQLRWLEHGYSIRMVETHSEVIGVDTEADLERVRAMVKKD